MAVGNLAVKISAPHNKRAALESTGLKHVVQDAASIEQKSCTPGAWRIDEEEKLVRYSNAHLFNKTENMILSGGVWNEPELPYWINWLLVTFNKCVTGT